jgi:hypothetical protein
LTELGMVNTKLLTTILSLYITIGVIIATGFGTLLRRASVFNYKTNISDDLSTESLSVNELATGNRLPYIIGGSAVIIAVYFTGIDYLLSFSIIKLNTSPELVISITMLFLLINLSIGFSLLYGFYIIFKTYQNISDVETFGSVSYRLGLYLLAYSSVVIIQISYYLIKSVFSDKSINGLISADIILPLPPGKFRAVYSITYSFLSPALILVILGILTEYLRRTLIKRRRDGGD